jgi:hypothetical protein
MLRLLIGTGALLMLVGFGAAGLQYWQTQPETAAEVGEEEERVEAWLISRTGALVAQDKAQAFLQQDRFVPGRTVTVTRTARLEELLTEGEKLPDAPYLQVLADIRAPKIAQALCPILTDRIAQVCAVNSARVVEGSVNPALGTARFRIELVYRLKPDATELPDLAAHVLEEEAVTPDLTAADLSTAEAALAALVDWAASACAVEGEGVNCRLLRLEMDWAPGSVSAARAEIARLAPLPEGMFPAPPLGPTVPDG